MKVIALRQITTMAAQDVEMSLGFNALGDHAQAQAMAEQNDCSHQRSITRAAIDAAHKQAVNLQLIDRKALQVGQ